MHTDTAVDLSVALGSLRIPNPLIAASGCFGYGVEYADAVDLAALGGVAVKGLFLAEREGHPPPRIVETPAGMLNAPPRAMTGPRLASCASRFQFAVFIACQMPVKLGRPYNRAGLSNK